MKKQRGAAVAVLFLGVCWWIFGCGSLSSLSPGTSRGTRPARGQEPLLRKFVVTADAKAGTLAIRSQGEAASGEAQTQARPFGVADGISLAGQAQPIQNGVLSGNVTVTSNHPQPLYDVRVVLGSISNSAVTVRNATGTTPLFGAQRPFWSYGNLNPRQTSSPRTWQFNVPSGVSFTFTVYVYANVFRYSSADGGALNAACFVDANTGWAVGDGGKILHTRDGGATWTPQSSPTRVDLKGVCFVDTNRGWAVGAEESILVTTNGGRQWRLQVYNPGSPLTLNAIAMLPEGFGWAAGAGGLLLSTENAGRLWIYEDAGTMNEIRSLYLRDVRTAWMTGNGVFRRTTDGFEWTAMTVPSGASADLRSIWFVSPTQGFAVGANGTLLQTVDGGTKWTRKTVPATSGVLLNSICFPTPTAGWIAGAGGLLRQTTDGGLTWTPATSPVTADLFGLACVPGNPSFCVAVGAGGTTLRAADGRTWQRGATGGPTANWRALEWFGPQHGWVVGAGGEIMRTTDYGDRWTSLPKPTTIDLNGVSFTSPTSGWVCGANATLLKTTNGGGNWAAVATGQSTATIFNAVRFFGDGQHGWVVGSRGTILRTTNGGAAWTTVPSPVAGAVYQGMAWSADLKIGLLVGANGASGIIVRTADGGATWTRITSSPTPDPLYAVRLLDNGVAVAVGAQGTILRSVDAGQTWSKQTSGVAEELRAVDFAGTAEGWAAGAGGRLLRTRDGGQTWQPVEAGTSRDLNALRVLDADNLWIAGGGGTLKQMN